LNTESVGDKLKNSICLSTGNETFHQNKANIKQKDFLDKQYDKKKLLYSIRTFVDCGIKQIKFYATFLLKLLIACYSLNTTYPNLKFKLFILIITPLVLVIVEIRFGWEVYVFLLKMSLITPA
jgi:hypothetical protein